MVASVICYSVFLQGLQINIIISVLVYKQSKYCWIMQPILSLTFDYEGLGVVFNCQNHF